MAKDRLSIGRIVFGSGDKESKNLDAAIRKLRNPASGVTLASHGWVTPCNICQQHTHAKWHDYSAGKIINPLALVGWLEMVEFDSVEEFREAAIAWVTHVGTLDIARSRADLKAADGNQASMEPAKATSASEAK